MSFSLRRAFDLKGRVAMIAGAAGILGPELGAGLAEFGARLVLVDRDADACEGAARRLAEQFGGDALAVTADVANEAQVRSAVARGVERFGRIDILVNAAATKSEGYFNPLEGYARSDWDAVLTTNLTGMFLMTREVVPRLIETGRGSIVNIASIYGVVGPDPALYEGSEYQGVAINTPPVYSASKAGVIGFTRWLATSLAARGVRANAITPGGVFSGQNDTFVARYSERAPLGRMARREELRGAALFLASDASSYVTGHNLVVDGGWTVR